MSTLWTHGPSPASPLPSSSPPQTRPPRVCDRGPSPSRTNFFRGQSRSASPKRSMPPVVRPRFAPHPAEAQGSPGVGRGSGRSEDEGSAGSSLSGGSASRRVRPGFHLRSMSDDASMTSFTDTVTAVSNLDSRMMEAMHEARSGGGGRGKEGKRRTLERQREIGRRFGAFRSLGRLLQAVRVILGLSSLPEEGCEVRVGGGRDFRLCGKSARSLLRFYLSPYEDVPSLSTHSLYTTTQVHVQRHRDQRHRDGRDRLLSDRLPGQRPGRRLVPQGVRQCVAL